MARRMMVASVSAARNWKVTLRLALVLATGLVFARRLHAGWSSSPHAIVERPSSTLPAPIQDASAASLDAGHVLLLGGLSPDDVSQDTIAVASPEGGHALEGRLPVAVHDAAAVRMGSAVYLFGGGTGTRQVGTITRINPRSGVSTSAGRLPTATSDHSAVVVGNTAYVVGGFTGSSWLDTIVAWRPGSRAHVAAHLPTPLRYAAVATARGRIIIAGGSLPDGTASRSVLEYVPATRQVLQIGPLPRPTTHAAAASLDGEVYVIGGRGASIGTPTARIVAIDLVTRRIQLVGTLADARSDLAALALGKRTPL